MDSDSDSDNDIDNAIEVLKAYKEGKTIQHRNKTTKITFFGIDTGKHIGSYDHGWVDVSKRGIFNFDKFIYRVKPEPVDNFHVGAMFKSAYDNELYLLAKFIRQDGNCRHVLLRNRSSLVEILPTWGMAVCCPKNEKELNDWGYTFHSYLSFMPQDYTISFKNESTKVDGKS